MVILLCLFVKWVVLKILVIIITIWVVFISCYFWFSCIFPLNKIVSIYLVIYEVILLWFHGWSQKHKFKSIFFLFSFQECGNGMQICLQPGNGNWILLPNIKFREFCSFIANETIGCSIVVWHGITVTWEVVKNLPSFTHQYLVCIFTILILVQFLHNR